MGDHEDSGYIALPSSQIVSDVDVLLLRKKSLTFLLREDMSCHVMSLMCLLSVISGPNIQSTFRDQQDPSKLQSGDIALSSSSWLQPNFFSWDR